MILCGDLYHNENNIGIARNEEAKQSAKTDEIFQTKREKLQFNSPNLHHSNTPLLTFRNFR